MKYEPITSESQLRNLFTKINSAGYVKFSVTTYMDAWGRQEGVPTEEEYYPGIEDAYAVFKGNCSSAVCTELRGIRPDGNWVPLFIGGTDDDVSEDGECVNGDTPADTAKPQDDGKSMFPYAVVTTYSWDDNVEVYLCTSRDEAKAVLRKLFDAEIELDTESGHEFTSEISDDGDFAKIFNYRASGDVDDCSWRIARTTNGAKILE